MFTVCFYYMLLKRISILGPQLELEGGCVIWGLVSSAWLRWAV